MGAAPKYDDHVRATERIMGTLHEQFPNASQRTLEDFTAPILDETRKKMDDGLTAGEMKPQTAQGQADADVLAKMQSEAEDEIQARPLERRVIGSATLDPVRGVKASNVPTRTKYRTEDEAAIGARIRSLLAIPAWRTRVENAVHSGDANKMAKVIADADTVFGPRLTSYRQAVAKARGFIELQAKSIFSQVPGKAVLS